MPTADMSDCYSKGVFSGAGDEIELSAGYREGDDDDLPLLKVHPPSTNNRSSNEFAHCARTDAVCAPVASSHAPPARPHTHVGLISPSPHRT